MRNGFLIRVLLPACIVVFWGGMTSSLVRDRILPERARAKASYVDAEVLSIRWQDIDEWAWIRKDGQTVGATAMSLERRVVEKPSPSHRASYLLTQNTVAALPVLGLEQRVGIRLAVELSPEFFVERFSATVRAGPVRVRCLGFTKGKRLYYRIEPPQGRADGVHGFLNMGDRPLSLQEALKPLFSRYFDLRVGESYTFEVLQPLGGASAGRVDVRIADEETIEQEGVEIRAFRIETTFNGITRNAWVDQGGHSLRRELLMGFVAERGGAHDIRRRYPSLGDELAVPEMDEEKFLNRARENAVAPTGDEPGLGMLRDVFGGV